MVPAAPLAIPENSVLDGGRLQSEFEMKRKNGPTTSNSEVDEVDRASLEFDIHFSLSKTRIDGLRNLPLCRGRRLTSSDKVYKKSTE